MATETANRWALITGAGRGIGRSIALTFAEAGYNLAICARSAASLDDVASQIKALGRDCLAVGADVSSPEDVAAFRAALGEKTEALHVIINNAGAYLDYGLVAESDPDDWWRTIEINVRGPYLIVRHFMDLMPEGGKIISLTSGKGYQAGQNSASYHISKAGLNMFSNALANELWQRKIDVNLLIPGPTATTTFTREDPSTGVTADAILERLGDTVPNGLPPWERVKHPDEVAALALQMASFPEGGPTGQLFSLARRPV